MLTLLNEESKPEFPQKLKALPFFHVYPAGHLLHDKQNDKQNDVNNNKTRQTTTTYCCGASADSGPPG